MPDKMTREEAIEIGKHLIREYNQGQKSGKLKMTVVFSDFEKDAIITLLSNAEQVENGIDLIITKMAWKALKEKGCSQMLETLRESDLHHVFGDYPEEDIVRARLTILTEEE